MKQKIIFLLIANAIAACSYCQCDKKNSLTSTGAEILNEKNEVRIRDTQRVTTINYDKKTIEIISGDQTLYGTIDSTYCNWILPFKEGNTYIRGLLSYDNGDQWVIKLIINGKDGKLTLLVDIEHPEASKMRFVLDKFGESK